jgi:hypothetical protein
MRLVKKITFCSIIGFLISSSCCAQNPADSLLIKQFEDSFWLRVFPPVQLYVKCIPVMCMLKIDINNTSKISGLTLSDSADSLFNESFKKNVNKIDVSLLEQYCVNRAIKNKTIVVPLHYSYRKSVCSTPIMDFKLLENYSSFNGKNLTGEIILLPPINTQTVMHDY